MTFENVQIFNYYDAASSSSELTANFVRNAIKNDDVVIEHNNKCVGLVNNWREQNNNIYAEIWLKNDFIYHAGAADFYIDQYEVIRARDNEMVALKIRYDEDLSWIERLKKRFSLNGTRAKT